MTASSAPTPGRPRSLGASLLDQVLAETLDPAYVRAAEASAARAADRPDGTASPARSRRLRGQILVALTLLLAGLLAAVTYREAAAGAQGREQVREALIEDVNRRSAVLDDLSSQLEALTGEVTSTRAAALAASAVGQRALDRLQDAERAAGLVAVTGPGLKVTLGNAAPAADSDPVGGSAQVPETGLVQDSDLQLVVNALWSAGAEAISINGQRLGPTTTIRQAGGAILVDFRPVASPYEVLAIGGSDALAKGFLTSPEATYVVGLQQRWGLQFDFARAEKLSLPAGTGPEVRWAQPVDGPAGPTTPASSPTTTANGD
jgi:uncharacterized protein YlxW (UPF0749 family)